MAEAPKARPPNIPSSLFGKGGVKAVPTKQSAPSAGGKPFFPIGGPLSEGERKEDKRPLYISALALLIAVAALYISMNGGALSKGQLAAIASDLERMQAKDLEVSAPVKTSVFVDKEIPFSELIPDYTVPVDIVIPLRGTYNGIMPSGNVRVTLNESIPMRISIPVKSSMFATKTIRINKEIPVNVYVSSKFRVGQLYGKDLQDIIDRIRNASK